MIGPSEQASQGSPFRAQEGPQAAHFLVVCWLKLLRDPFLEGYQTPKSKVFAFGKYVLVGGCM